jgi:peptidoglycan/xylan/chitin deacetylase (PgdA/CDA1 family)
VTWIILAVAGVAVLAHTAPFPFVLDWVHSSQAVWSMPRTRTPTVYLTFDDGPNPRVTPQLLDMLRRERVSATFFIIDRHLTAETAPIVRRMFEDGHAVGLHSHTRALTTLDPVTLADVLERAADRIEQLTGHRPCRAFRPHAGWRSSTMFRGVRRFGGRLFGWGWLLWDSDPFRKRTAERLVPRLAGRAGDGSIIVMHDGHHVDPAADRLSTIATVEHLIPRLRAKGFAFGTVCETKLPQVPN